jgi:hypothetical protein
MHLLPEFGTRKRRDKVVPVLNGLNTTYGGVDVWIHVFLTSALVEGEWSTSSPGRFKPGEIDPGTHGIGGWVGPERVWTTWRAETS